MDSHSGTGLVLGVSAKYHGYISKLKSVRTQDMQWIMCVRQGKMQAPTRSNDSFPKSSTQLTKQRKLMIVTVLLVAQRRITVGQVAEASKDFQVELHCGRSP